MKKKVIPVKSSEKYKKKIIIITTNTDISFSVKECFQRVGYNDLNFCVGFDEFLESALKKKPDFILIDKNFNGQKSGIDLAHYINETSNIPFAFITTEIDDLTIESIMLTNPYGILIHPFDEPNLLVFLEVAFLTHERLKNESLKNKMVGFVLDNHSFFIKEKQNLERVVFSEILYVESNGNYVFLYTTTKVHTLRQSLLTLKDNLPNNFVQIHMSYIVNMNCIKSINPDILIMVNDSTLKINKTIYDKLVKQLNILE